MHELGVLLHTVKMVCKVAQDNSINKIKHITLAVGDESGFVPVFMEKLFPVAVEHYPIVHDAKLIIEMVSGQGLVIKDIGY